MDIADITEEKNAILLQASLSARRETGPVATGYCLNCEGPLPDGIRWCSPECRDDWQKEMDRSGNGG